MYTVTVRRMENSKQYGVYLDGELVEGGFFSKEIAMDVAAEYAGFETLPE